MERQFRPHQAFGYGGGMRSKSEALPLGEKMMGFLDKFEKDLGKIGFETGSKPPRYWFSTGNYVLNRIISGSFYKGIPQGRVMSLAGPSGAGKSFLASNLIRNAQKEGALNVVVDTEHSLDNNFASGVGVNPEKNYTYVEADTIPDCKRIISSYIQMYKKEYGYEEDAPKTLITIDSLDMLMTETEETQFNEGKTTGDMGQRSKQLKQMLREFVQNIKHVNISMIVTSQVYRNQDPYNGEGIWMIGDAVKFSLSQIVLLTKLRLKNKEKETQGIKMRCEGYKTRFTKPFQTVWIEIPYDEGMNPHSGLIDVAKAMGVVENKGAWYNIVGSDKKFYKKDVAQYADNILENCEKKTKAILAIDEQNIEEDPDQGKGPSAQAQRKALFDKKQEKE
jgi:recombination protein RecA